MGVPHSIMLVAMVYLAIVGCCRHNIYHFIITIYHYYVSLSFR